VDKDRRVSTSAAEDGLGDFLSGIVAIRIPSIWKESMASVDGVFVVVLSQESFLCILQNYKVPIYPNM